MLICHHDKCRAHGAGLLGGLSVSDIHVLGRGFADMSEGEGATTEAPQGVTTEEVPEPLAEEQDGEPGAALEGQGPAHEGATAHSLHLPVACHPPALTHT